jgi:hypothetical protein
MPVRGIFSGRRQQLGGTSPVLIRLADYAHREKIGYNEALDRVLRGKIVAQRIGARWFVEVPDFEPDTPVT